MSFVLRGCNMQYCHAVTLTEFRHRDGSTVDAVRVVQKLELLLQCRLEHIGAHHPAIAGFCIGVAG
jgi:hypothetical protein